MWAIAKMTILMWIRDRVFYGIASVSGLLVFCSLFLNEMIVGDKSKIVNDLGLSVMLFLGVFMMLFTISTTHQDKSLYMILSRPISRASWVLGNYLGNSTILLINTLWLSALIALLTWISGGEWRSGASIAIGLIYLELLLVTALSIFFATFMTSAALSKFCTLCVFLVGHISEEVRLIMASSKNVVLRNVFDGLYYTFPNLSAFDVKTEAIYHLPIETSHVGFAVIYGVAYIGILLSLSTWAFNQSDM